MRKAHSEIVTERDVAYLLLTGLQWRCYPVSVTAPRTRRIVKMTAEGVTISVYEFFKIRLKVILMAVVLLTAIGVLATFSVRHFENGSESDGSHHQSLWQIIDMRERIAELKSMAETDPMKTVAIKELGDAYLELGNLQGESGAVSDASESYKLAADEYRRFLAHKPGDEDVTIYLSLAVLNMGEWEEAVRIMEEQTKKMPSSQKSWYVMGWTYNKAERKVEAEWALKKALHFDANSKIGKTIEILLAQLGTDTDSLNTPSLPPNHP